MIQVYDVWISFMCFFFVSSGLYCWGYDSCMLPFQPLDRKRGHHHTIETRCFTKCKAMQGNMILIIYYIRLI